eukprot:gene54375-45104_t
MRTGTVAERAALGQAMARWQRVEQTHGRPSTGCAG